MALLQCLGFHCCFWRPDHDLDFDLHFSVGRKDDRRLRFWLTQKPAAALAWEQHIDLSKKGIIIWVAFDFSDLPYPELGLFQHSSEWKDGISPLRRTSCQSGAPWCTEPPLGSLPRAIALCSMPVTSRRGNTIPLTYRWLLTQVSASSTALLLFCQTRMDLHLSDAKPRLFHINTEQ